VTIKPENQQGYDPNEIKENINKYRDRLDDMLGWLRLHANKYYHHFAGKFMTSSMMGNTDNEF
jgi:hypothetical protein